MPVSPSPKILLTHYEWSLRRLEEILKEEKSDYFRDAALERFGFTYDLAIKCLAAVRRERGEETLAEPEELWRWAGEMGYGPGEDEATDLLESYNKLKLPNKGGVGDAVFAKLDGYFATFNDLMKNLAALYSENSKNSDNSDGA